MKSFKLYQYVFINFFFFVSMILFSFAPFLALKSDTSVLISTLLYGIFFICLFGVIIFASYKKVFFQKQIVFFIIFFIFLFLGLLHTNLTAVSSQLKNLLLPLLIFLLLYSIRYNFNLKYKKILFILFICILANCVFSVITVYSFNGDFSHTYIYEVIKGTEYNYLRAGKLRAFGFLQSAVILSNYLTIFLIPLIWRINIRKNWLVRFFFIILMLYTLYLTGSRTPFLSLFLSIFFIKFFNKNRNLVFLFSIITITLLLLFVFVMANYMDLSALGRIKQYAEAFNLISKNPIGYGIGYAGYPFGKISFDCSLLVLFVDFGILGIFFVVLFYKRAIKNIAVTKSEKIKDSLVINLFLLSGFVNTIHLGILVLTILLWFIEDKQNEKTLHSRSI